MHASQAAQAALQKRAEQLELTVAEYNGLLLAAEGGAPEAPRASATGGSPARRGSPVHAATRALQRRRMEEELGELRERLKAAEEEAASVRR